MYWYTLNDPDQIDTPALLVYPERVQKNIERAIKISGDVNRLRPHVKTHKIPQVAAMHLERDIHKFKCATVAEAEMLALAGAHEILLAHQPVGPKGKRLAALAAAYPKIIFGTIIDNETTLRQLSAAAETAGITLDIWIDIDNGMHRSGIEPGRAAQQLYHLIEDLPGVSAGGLHVYDGHYRDRDFAQRKAAADKAFGDVDTMCDAIEASGSQRPKIVAGGSPTFPVHALRAEVDLSPGTYVYWDAGYGEGFPDMPFEPAALVLTRVISKPGGKRVCLDLGSKSVSADNPIDNRVRILNADVTAYIGQSEEHLVVEVADPTAVTVGDVWYGVPFHICYAVAQHEKAYAIIDGVVSDIWPIVARSRQLRY